MTNNELITLRMNILGGMNSYIFEETTSDDIIIAWERLGQMKKDITEEYLKSTCEDNFEWTRLCALFGTLVNM